MYVCVFFLSTPNDYVYELNDELFCWLIWIGKTGYSAGQVKYKHLHTKVGHFNCFFFQIYTDIYLFIGALNDNINITLNTLVNRKNNAFVSCFKLGAMNGYCFKLLKRLWHWFEYLVKTCRQLNIQVIMVIPNKYVKVMDFLKLWTHMVYNKLRKGIGSYLRD